MVVKVELVSRGEHKDVSALNSAAIFNLPSSNVRQEQSCDKQKAGKPAYWIIADLLKIFFSTMAQLLS